MKLRWLSLAVVMGALAALPTHAEDAAPAPPSPDAAIEELLKLKPEEVAALIPKMRAEAGQKAAEVARLRGEADALTQQAEALMQRLDAVMAVVTKLAYAAGAAPEPMMAAAPPPAPAPAPAPSPAPAPPAADAMKAAFTFAEHVQPILQARCIRCHNPDRTSGGLNLSTFAAVMEGGSSGQVVAAGDADGSRLFRLITGAEEPKMPPSGDALSADDLNVFREWIMAGAPADAAAAATMQTAKAEKKEVALPVPTADGPPPMPEAPLAPATHRSVQNVVARAVAVNPFSPLMAVGSDHQVLLYDLEKKALLGALPFPEGDVFTLRFSANGELLVAGGGQEGLAGMAVLWNVRSAERLGNYGEGYDTLLAADVSPDGRFVAAGGTNKKVRVYSVVDGAEMYAIEPHTDWITAARFSPDGELLATADRQGGLYLWQAGNGRPVENLRGHEGAIHDLAYSFDSTVLASAGEDGTIQLWDTWKYNRIRSFKAHEGQALSVAFSKDGELLSTGTDGAAKRWQQDGNNLASYDGLGDWGYQARFGAGDSLVLAGTWNGNVIAWDRASGERAGEFATVPKG